MTQVKLSLSTVCCSVRILRILLINFSMGSPALVILEITGASVSDSDVSFSYSVEAIFFFRVRLFFDVVVLSKCFFLIPFSDAVPSSN